MLLGKETSNDSGLSLSLSSPLCVCFFHSKDNPAANCQEIYKKDAGAVSGAYWIKGKGKPFQVSMLPNLSLPKSLPFFLGGGWEQGGHSYYHHGKEINSQCSLCQRWGAWVFYFRLVAFINTFLSCWAFSPKLLEYSIIGVFFFLSI